MSAIYVQIDRDDGSRTYKGPYRSPSTATREAQAWAEAFPKFTVRVAHDVADFKRWTSATRLDRWGRQSRYYPTMLERG